MNKKLKSDLLNTHYELGDSKRRLKSENRLKYNSKPVVAPEFIQEQEENKEKIEKQNFDIRSAQLKNTFYRTQTNPGSVGNELY